MNTKLIFADAGGFQTPMLAVFAVDLATGKNEEPRPLLLTASRDLADAAGRAYSAELTDTKVHVHCYRDGFLHAKSLTVDDEIGMVGSANFDVRSFRLDIEANLIFYTATAVKALREIQDQYLAKSVPFLEQWRDRSWLRRIADDSAKLISPLA